MLASRNGGRHPDSRDAGRLRGLPEKRGSWPVRLACSGARSPAFDRTGDERCPLEDEEGNVVSVRQAHALAAETPNKRLHDRGHVLRSVQRPVHVNRHSTLRVKARGGGAVGSVSRSGKPAQAGGTGTEVGTNGRKRGSPRITASLEKAVRDA